MKKNVSVNLKAFLSVLIAMLMVSLIAAMPVSAAYTSKSLSGNSSTVTIHTGSGFAYWIGWSKTKATISNTSKSGKISVWTPGGTVYTLDKGQSVTFSLGGEGKNYTYTIKKVGIGSRNYSVSTSAGSVW